MAKIPDETIQQIAAANDIVDVIGGYFPLKRAGSAYWALCPFHREKSPSFQVNPQMQIYHCFGCGAGGGVIRFVMAYENLDFPAAVRRLAERANIPIVEQEYTPAEQRKADLRRRLLSLHHEAAKWFHQHLLKSAEAEPARAYLKKRGITSEIAKAWRLGYAPNAWDRFANWAAQQGYSADEISKSGMVSIREGEPGGEGAGYYDRFRHRIVFPICNDLGEVIAFSGRTLEADPKSAKYVNSPETILFTKGHVLFGMDKSKRALINTKLAIVCEGQFDLITAFESGVHNVIAPQGTAFTAHQARILKRFVEEVVLCFDADAAGTKAAERSLPALLDNNLHVRVAEMPEGHDPDSLIRSEGVDAFRRRIDEARDFFDYQIARHAASADWETPRGKLRFARKAAAWVGLVSDAVLAGTLIHKVTARLGVSEKDFRNLVPKRGGGPEEGEETEKPPLPELTQNLRLLCLAALRDRAARQRMLEEDWRFLLENISGAELLRRILNAPLDPADPSSISAFSAELDPDEESVVTSLLLDRRPADLDRIEDCREGMEKEEIHRLQAEVDSRSRRPGLSVDQQILMQKEVRDLDNIQRRLEEIGSRLRFPDLPVDQQILLQKERLDLHKRLTDIGRPFLPSV